VGVVEWDGDGGVGRGRGRAGWRYLGAVCSAAECSSSGSSSGSGSVGRGGWLLTAQPAALSVDLRCPVTRAHPSWAPAICASEPV